MEEKYWIRIPCLNIYLQMCFEISCAQISILLVTADLAHADKHVGNHVTIPLFLSDFNQIWIMTRTCKFPLHRRDVKTSQEGAMKNSLLWL
jgi:hypothetical protein